MPIYAYRCGDCGFEKDVLQKFSDAPLSDCPQCHKPAFARMITAPTFQLKGTGWYVTDFRGGKDGAKGSEKAGEKGSEKAGEGSADSSAGNAGNGGNGGEAAGGAGAGKSADAGGSAAAATSQASKPAGTDAPKAS